MCKNEDQQILFGDPTEYKYLPVPYFFFSLLKKDVFDYKLFSC